MSVPANAMRSVMQEKVQGRKFYFEYAVPVVASLAATASSTQTLNFDQDSIFVWLKTVRMVDLAGAAITSSARIVPLITAQITDMGSGQSFFNNAVPIDSFAGESASLPFIMPAPQMVQPNTSFKFLYTNYSAATTYTNLFVVLIGYKFYPMTQQ